MQRFFKRSLESLDEVFAFIDLCDASDASFPIRVAVEEVFVNMVKYNRNGAGDIQIELRCDGSSIEATLVDADSDPFDITEYRGADLSAPLEKRSVGGLGIHLVRRMMDEVCYEHKDRRTQIRLIKHL